MDCTSTGEIEMKERSPRSSFCGRIHPDKGVHLAVAVARMSGLPLLIAGIIPDRTYFHEQVEPYLDGMIRYIGPLDVAGNNELFDTPWRSSISGEIRPCAGESECPRRAGDRYGPRLLPRGDRRWEHSFPGEQCQ